MRNGHCKKQTLASRERRELPPLIKRPAECAAISLYRMLEFDAARVYGKDKPFESSLEW